MKRSTVLLCLAPVVALAATVRTDRPRMLLSNGSGRGTPLATFVSRCTTDPAYKTRCTNALNAGGGSYPAINDAAGYLVNADATRCTNAYNTLQTVAADTPGTPDPHSFISNNQRVMLQLTVVRDWCDPVLSQTQKDWIESTIVAWADWYSGTRGGYPLDIWHDDFNNVWNSVALAGLALKGTAYDTKADGYLMAADTTWKNTIFPALKYEGDFWHEGFTYVQPALGSAIVYATAWSIATDEDLFAWAQQNAGDVFNGWLMMHAYLMRPDYRYAYFGDSSDNKQSIELFSRVLIDLLTQGTGNLLGQGLSLEIKANSRPGYDYSGADGYLPALFYDASKDAQAIARSTLPKTRWLSPGAADVAVLRSGWGPDDTWVVASCGDWFGSHQKIESGQFQIFHRAILTTSSGYYDNFDTDHWQNWFSQHSVHANTLAVYEPNEFFPTTASIANASANVNEGGQRPLRRSKNGSAYPNPDLATYLTHKTSAPFTETGDLELFKDDGCVTWVSCDLTAAYDSPGFTTNGNAAKVDEVERQFVWVPPDTLVVWDWVESTDAGYEKRWLLQTPPSPQVNGSSYTLQNDGGTLFAQTVLPAGATVTTIANFTINGVSHAPNPAGLESFGTRLEIKPAASALRDYFLHVFSTAASAPAVTVLSEDASGVRVKIDRGADQVTLSLTKNKSAGLGGTATITAGGSTTCTSNTLDGGSGGGAGGGGGGSAAGGGGGSTGGGTAAGGGSGTGGGGASSTGGGAAGGAGGGGGGGVGPVKSSCGCNAGGGALGALLLLLAVVRRRTR